MVMEGQIRIRKDRQGQGETDRDKEGCNNLVLTEGGTDQDKEKQTRLKRDRPG